MLLTYFLISSFQPTLIQFRHMTSHHVTCHVTTIMCLFIINKKKKKKKIKRNIKSRNIDKRKLLVSKCTITHSIYLLLGIPFPFAVCFLWFLILIFLLTIFWYFTTTTLTPPLVGLLATISVSNNSHFQALGSCCFGWIFLLQK